MPTKKWTACSGIKANFNSHETQHM